MATYPSGVFAPSTKNSGDTIQGSHVNDLQAEMTAVENELVTSGLTNLLKVNAGVQFPATQAASSDANTLDDYEEGNWTPSIGGSGGQSGQAYSVQVGRAVKIGKLVLAQGRIVLTTLGTVTGTVQIQGLPFTAENTTNAYGVAAIRANGLTTAIVAVTGLLTPNGTAVDLRIRTAANANDAGAAQADLANGSSFEFSIMYLASA